MQSWKDVLAKTKTMTFDCYGTLIDWRSGVHDALGTVFGAEIVERVPTLFEQYVRTEAEVEAEPYQPYRRVLSTTVERMARQLNLQLPDGKAEAMAAALPAWQPFPDTNAALALLKKHFRLGVLSNIDRDLFAGTVRQFSIDFDFVVTAEEVRSYKPGLGHFHRFLELHGKRESTLHVGQSPYHDGIPTDKLGIAYIWINRYNETNTTHVRPVAEFPDLCSLAESACAAS